MGGLVNPKDERPKLVCNRVSRAEQKLLANITSYRASKVERDHGPNHKASLHMHVTPRTSHPDPVRRAGEAQATCKSSTPLRGTRAIQEPEGEGRTPICSLRLPARPRKRSSFPQERLELCRLPALCSVHQTQLFSPQSRHSCGSRDQAPLPGCPG